MICKYLCFFLEASILLLWFMHQFLCQRLCCLCSIYWIHVLCLQICSVSQDCFVYLGFFLNPYEYMKFRFVFLDMWIISLKFDVNYIVSVNWFGYYGNPGNYFKPWTWEFLDFNFFYFVIYLFCNFCCRGISHPKSNLF